MATETSLEKTKAMATRTRVLGLIIGLVAGVITFIVTFVCTSDKETLPRVFTALDTFFCGFCFSTAIFYLIFAIAKKDRFSGVIAYFTVAIGLILLLILLVAWYFVLFAAVVVFLLFWLVSTMLYSRKLTFVADNEKPDYKNYEQRKAEEAAREPEEEEELPQIKSFKD